ncbi:MAG: hypothetical protein M1596_01570 [Firmicutes bacterium]|nr:hypothetical protein [Bacillota bacterium]
MVNGKSALEWVMDRFRSRPIKAAGL